MDSQSLLADIESFLVKHEMADSAFGRKVMNDWKFVRDLRAGKRRVLMDTAAKVRSYMANYTAGETDGSCDNGGDRTAQAAA